MDHEVEIGLVSTPPYISGELQRGYFLRLAEINGYRSISSLTSISGIGYSASRANVLPLYPLLPLLNRGGAEVARLEGAFTNGCPVPSKQYFDIKAAKVCPQCVEEYGHIQQFWGLACAVACPIHKRSPLTHCPACARKIGWSRQGLTKCVCDHDFLLAQGEPVECKAILALQHLIHAKCQKEQISAEILEDAGFSVGELIRFTLNDLLKLIKKLSGQLAVDSELTADKRHLHDVSIAAKALVNWPHGFHAYLESTSSNRSIAVTALGLRTQNERVYAALFKSSFCKGSIEFMKKAFFEWSGGSSRPGRVHPRNKSAILTEVPRYIGVNEASRLIGVRPPTLKNLIKLGILDAHLGSDGKHWLINTSNRLPRKNSSTPSLSSRDAAYWLGIPQSVLQHLRMTRTFVVTRIPDRCSSFSCHDLDVFRTRLLLRAENDSDEMVMGDFYMMVDIMRMKHGGPEIRAAIIRAVLDGELKVFGHSCRDICELKLQRHQVDNFIDGMKAQREFLPVYDAARIIACDPLVIDALIEQEYLGGKTESGRMQISLSSIKSFQEHYTPVAEIAREAGTNSSRIITFCRDHNIQLLWIDRRGKESPQPFIHVEQVMRLEPLIGLPILRSQQTWEPLQTRSASK